MTCHPLTRSKRSNLFWPPPFYRLSLLLAVSEPAAGSPTFIVPSSASAVFCRHLQNLAFFLCIHQQPPPISTTPCHSSATHCCWLTSVINPALARHLYCYVLIACILRVCHPLLFCLWVYDVHTVTKIGCVRSFLTTNRVRMCCVRAHYCKCESHTRGS